MTQRIVGTVVGLPRVARGHRTTVWWGMVLLVTIEATVMASLITSYYYLRAATVSWPPEGIALPELETPTLAYGLLILSAAPVWWALRGIQRGSRTALNLGMPLGTLLVVGYLVVSLMEQRAYSWSTNVYGSIVYTIAGYSLLHGLVLVALGVTVSLLGWKGHFGREQHTPVHAAWIYWAFMALTALPVYGTLYLAPGWI